MAVNDAGQIQCKLCLRLFSSRGAKEALKRQHNDDSLPKELLNQMLEREYSELLCAKRLRRKWSRNMRMEQYVYLDEDGKVRNTRTFYAAHI